MEDPILKAADPINIVHDRVYIGNHVAANNLKILKSHGITHIINAAIEIPDYFRDISPTTAAIPSKDFYYLRLNLEDSPEEDIVHVLQPSYRYIISVLKRNPNNKVLIHCHAGISRSGSVAIYYLMMTLKKSFRECLDILRKSRPIVNPNKGYTRQLEREKI